VVDPAEGGFGAGLLHRRAQTAEDVVGRRWIGDLGQTVEVDDPGVEKCLLTYRATLRAAGVGKRAYLEMWCCMKGGEYFSKGFHNALEADTEWTRCEIPFWLKAEQRPDKLKLNLVIEGGGTVDMRDVELLLTPLE